MMVYISVILKTSTFDSELKQLFTKRAFGFKNNQLAEH